MQAVALSNGGTIDFPTNQGPKSIRIIGESTLQLMTRNSLPKNTTCREFGYPIVGVPLEYGIGFGLGFSVRIESFPCFSPQTPGSFGWSGAAGTFFFIDPARKIVCVFMTQKMFHNSIAVPYQTAFTNIIYGSINQARL
jgi:CubicO group peptidase (beta-lactamase class C family)